VSGAAASSLRTDARVIGLVGLAHGLSHFFQLTIPPLFPLLKDEFGVSYAALGAVLAVFYAVSGVMQTVAGFLVDRLGARTILLAGLALTALGTLAAGLAPSFAWLVVAAAIGGLGNSVFHPADLALLNGKVDVSRLGYAFSVHGITGNIGWVLAPLFVVPIAQAHGWRVALVAAGALGLVACAALATQRVLAGELRQAGAGAPGAGGAAAAGIAPLLARPVLLAFLFFFLYACALIGFQTFLTAALTALHGVSLTTASTALTAFLVGGAAGILAGGVAAARIRRHNLFAAVGVAIPAALALVVSASGLGGAALVALLTVTGFVLGSIGPSRDIIVRGIAPPAARGKVYGFVYSGLDLSGLVAPLAFGWALDHGRPDLVFIGSAAVLVAAIPTVLRMRRRDTPPPEVAPAPVAPRAAAGKAAGGSQ
jgi:MFS family permease